MCALEAVRANPAWQDFALDSHIRCGGYSRPVREGERPVPLAARESGAPRVGGPYTRRGRSRPPKSKFPSSIGGDYESLAEGRAASLGCANCGASGGNLLGVIHGIRRVEAFWWRRGVSLRSNVPRLAFRRPWAGRVVKMRAYMSFRQVDMAAAVVFTVIGLFFVFASVPIYSVTVGTSPGAGVWPFWLGVMLTVCGVGYLSYAFRSAAPQKFLTLTRVERGSLWGSILSLFLYIAIMPYLGFALCTFLFLLFNLHVISGYRWIPTVVVAAASTAVCWYFFAKALFMPFPKGFFGL